MPVVMPTTPATASPYENLAAAFTGRTAVRALHVQMGRDWDADDELDAMCRYAVDPPGKLFRPYLLLEACAAFLDEPAGRFRDMTEGSDTIVRVLYYPPVPPSAPPGAVRSAAHEDINLITLLSGATAEGLELLRRDGSWMPVHTGFDTIVVDAADMLQNVTNGLYRSTTHRVVNPPDAASERFSMPCFVHARLDVDLSPLPSCVARTGGAPRYPRITAGEYLAQRLREIGLDARG